MPEPPTTVSNGTEKTALLRALPSVDKLLAHPALAAATAALPALLLTTAARETLNAARSALLAGSTDSASLDALARQAAERAWLSVTPSLTPVINATGVIIHTNLGRAPLSQAALEAINNAGAYSNLEYNLAEGERGSRYTHAVGILKRVTGCEDALVVNNNAAALVLVLTCFAQGKEALLSRGQSVEIGGGFRIPDIMKTSGVRLVEVGTTNRTYTRDYSEAITAETAIIMRIHSSNFRIIGFTTEPDLKELGELAQSSSITLVDDIGSGALLNTAAYGLHPEPTVQSSLAAGADLVLFSGDKLLGGPQCGIIAGKSALISRLKKHPLTRALRVDKLTLAALEATLLHYLKGEAETEIPIWRMISMSAEKTGRHASAWAERLQAAGITCRVTEGQSAIGGGSLPGETLPTRLLSIPLTEQQAGEKAAFLRCQAIPVIARIDAGALIVDPRTVLDNQEEALLSALLVVLAPAPLH